jgi:hypothetical protein
LPEAANSASSSSWRRKILTIPGAIAGTALAAAVTWGVAQLLSSVQTKAAARHPISWVVESNPAQIGGFSDLPILLKLPVGRTPTTGPGPGCDGFTAWAHRQGGVDAGATRFAVILRGRMDGQVLISNARAVVVGRATPVRGIAVECPTAGEAQMRPLMIDLDEPHKVAHYEARTHRFGFTLEKGETETFLVTARADRATYLWYLELTIVAGEKPQKVRVTNGGDLFKTTTPARRNVWQWNFEDAWLGPNGQKVRKGEPLGGTGGGA